MKLSTMLINGALSICAAVAFTACGSSGSSGSSSSPSASGNKTGYFYDEAVGGLTYSCTGSGQTVTGTTGSDGSFRYNTGDTCTFSVGRVTVGLVVVPSDGRVFPQDIAGVSRTDTSNGTVTKIAQFLQSISDTSSGSISISSTTAQKLANISGNIANLDLTTVVTAAAKTVVDAGVAQSRLGSYINQIAQSDPTVTSKGAKAEADAKAAEEAANAPAEEVATEGEVATESTEENTEA